MSYSGQTTRHSPCLCLTKTKREKEDQHGQRGDEERSTSTLRASFLAQSKSELPQKAAIIVRPPARSTGATAASPGSGQETKGCRPATTPPNPHTPTRQRRAFDYSPGSRRATGSGPAPGEPPERSVPSHSPAHIHDPPSGSYSPNAGAIAEAKLSAISKPRERARHG